MHRASVDARDVRAGAEAAKREAALVVTVDPTGADPGLAMVVGRRATRNRPALLQARTAALRPFGAIPAIEYEESSAARLAREQLAGIGRPVMLA
jgi:hypothetical protein